MFFLYLDPGTGSLLLYAIIGIATTFVFLLKRLISKLQLLIFGKVSITNKHYDIVLHSEGSRYFSTFKNIIEYFSEKKIKITYITAQKDDIAFQLNNPYVEVFCPGNEYQTYTFLNNLDADIVISTTPNLDIYMWKKSKKVKKYIHIFHSPTSIDFYEKYGLSYYDIIFSAVDKTKNAQCYLDKKRNCKEKEYYNIGCPYLDELYKESKSFPKTENTTTVLYAPSWGSRSSLNTIGKNIISSLISQGINVIFRPHPQSFISDKDLITSIINDFNNNSLFLLDNKTSGLISMNNSDAIITDFSGILFDYKILFNKPIFLASNNINIHGYEIEDIPDPLQFDISYSKLNSIELNDEVLSDIKQYINNSPKNNNSNEYLYNIGNASKYAVEKIVEIWKEIK